MTEPVVVLYDFNDPPNDAGFYEAYIQPEQEDYIRRGDTVYLRDLSDPDVGKLCRVRAILAVLQPEEM